MLKPDQYLDNCVDFLNYGYERREPARVGLLSAVHCWKHSCSSWQGLMLPPGGSKGLLKCKRKKFEPTKEKQGSLVFYSPQGHKESDTT